MGRLYRYCGLTLESEIRLPVLEPSTSGNSPDIEVRRTSLAKVPDDLDCYGPNWAVSPNESWWWLGDRARFRIRRNLIDIEATETDDSFICALLLEAPMVMAMIHRGEFCLNASAAMVDGKAVAFCGASGSGRSTAIARLWQQGQPIICDSLARISFSKSKLPLIWPQGSGILLWPHSLALLGLDHETGSKVRAAISLRRLHAETIREPVRLDRIYWRNPHSGSCRAGGESTGSPTARRRFNRFSAATSGRLWITPSGNAAAHFQWCYLLARGCEFRKAPQEFFNRIASVPRR